MNDIKNYIAFYVLMQLDWISVLRKHAKQKLHSLSQLAPLKPPTQEHIQFPVSKVPPFWHIRLQAGRKESPKHNSFVMVHNQVSTSHRGSLTTTTRMMIFKGCHIYYIYNYVKLYILYILIERYRYNIDVEVIYLYYNLYWVKYCTKHLYWRSFSALATEGRESPYNDFRKSHRSPLVVVLNTTPGP